MLVSGSFSPRVSLAKRHFPPRDQSRICSPLKLITQHQSLRSCWFCWLCREINLKFRKTCDRAGTAKACFKRRATAVPNSIDSKFVPKVLSYPFSPWERGWIDRILHGSGATFEIIQFSQEPLWLLVQQLEFSSTRQLNSTGSAVLHGSGTARFQTSCYCRAELNS